MTDTEKEEQTTETEFGNRCERVGVGRGRLEVVGELVEWVAEWKRNYPTSFSSPRVKDFVTAFLHQCQEIIQAIETREQEE